MPFPPSVAKADGAHSPVSSERVRIRDNRKLYLFIDLFLLTGFVKKICSVVSHDTSQYDYGIKRANCQTKALTTQGNRLRNIHFTWEVSEGRNSPISFRKTGLAGLRIDFSEGTFTFREEKSFPYRFSAREPQANKKICTRLKVVRP